MKAIEMEDYSATIKLERKGLGFMVFDDWSDQVRVVDVVDVYELGDMYDFDLDECEQVYELEVGQTFFDGEFFMITRLY